VRSLQIAKRKRFGGGERNRLPRKDWKKKIGSDQCKVKEVGGARIELENG